MRYRIKYGRFGAYFYDNIMNMDLDLNNILTKLRKLDVYEKEIYPLMTLKNLEILNSKLKETTANGK